MSKYDEEPPEIIPFISPDDIMDHMTKIINRIDFLCESMDEMHAKVNMLDTKITENAKPVRRPRTKPKPAPIIADEPVKTPSAIDEMLPDEPLIMEPKKRGRCKKST